MTQLFNKYPDLQRILGETGQEEAFTQLIDRMNARELVELKSYIQERLDACHHKQWENNQGLRNIDAQIAYLKLDYYRVRTTVQSTVETLSSAFHTVFKDPKNAQQQCWESEKENGMAPTEHTLHRQPSRFGTLRGIDLFGFMPFNPRYKAKKTAATMPYAMLRKNYSEGTKILNWLNHMLQGAK